MSTLPLVNMAVIITKYYMFVSKFWSMIHYFTYFMLEWCSQKFGLGAVWHFCLKSSIIMKLWWIRFQTSIYLVYRKFGLGANDQLQPLWLHHSSANILNKLYFLIIFNWKSWSIGNCGWLGRHQHYHKANCKDIKICASHGQEQCVL